jgi:erythromycin esterase-like protein
MSTSRIATVAMLGVVSGVSLELAQRPGGGGLSVAGQPAAKVEPAAEAAAGVDPARVAWVRANAAPFRTVEAGNGFEDLQKLKEMIGDARIVAMGESTHGSREQFQMKHRIVEFLASEMGFRLFSIEANMPESYKVDEFVSGGTGDENALIRGMYFWTWSTDEVADMVRWMRAFNETNRGQAGKGQIAFTGFDMQFPAVAGGIATGFLAQHDAALEPSAREWLAKVEKLSAQSQGGGGGEFSTVRARFPVADARGKKIKLSGWIRTEGVEGFAGLWWRADAKDKPAVAFDNMQNRGVQGTTDWTACSLELNIPEEADNIDFGTLLVGSGKAWFDGLSVEIDGKPYSSDALGFDFEEEPLKGFAAGGGGFAAASDAAVFKSGARSIRLESQKKANERPDPGAGVAVMAGVDDVLSKMTASRDAYAKATSEREADWAIQNWRVIRQYTDLMTDQSGMRNVRDESMAENVKWILDQAGPDSKIILWAHNWHVSRFDQWMGSHLAKMYGDKYRVLGFSTSTGEYTAVSQGGLTANPLQEPPIGSAEWHFRAAAAGGEGAEAMPLFFLDLRRADARNPASYWLKNPILFRSVGALAMDQQFMQADISQGFDIIVHTDKTTAARQLAAQAKGP